MAAKLSSLPCFEAFGVIFCPEFFAHTFASYQKNPRVRKMFVRNSGAGNGRANFMGAWKNAFFLQEKTHGRKIPPFRVFFWRGGGSADFSFMGARIFLIVCGGRGSLARF